ncbi:hypothetical protein RhiirC2_804802 [Rhizophagus irregularis]|uniref:Uncharacterized protein n=1 Tax=Rhizophagus irregularis TaxID=588596 RepID=A0A2N1KWJ8_9GLOM|nr:hypothetical protein RhiirC2_804802 [Rhizophagus irregularis]
MKEIYDDHCADMKYEQHRINARIKWDTTPDQGEYREDLCDLIIEVTNARHNYGLKLLELSIEVTPEVPPVSEYLPKSEYKNAKREERKLHRNLHKKSAKILKF